MTETKAVLKGLYILDQDAFEGAYGPDERRIIGRHIDLVAPPMKALQVKADPSVLNEVEVIFSGWGGPSLTEELLEAAPRLQAVFYAGGSVAGIMTPVAWERGITITTAAAANAVPVAEYTLATILFGLRHGWRLSRTARQERRFPGRDDAPGSFGTTVGVVSLGLIGRKLLELLRPFDLNVLAFDPHVSQGEGEALGATMVELDELFERSDVATIHTPLLPETAGMIRGRHIASMKQGGTFVNSARGEIVNQPELIQVARERPDLQFVLDVCDPEPPAPDCALFDLPNVVLTPHIAGSLGPERRRMGQYMVEELLRYTAGEPLRYAVTPEQAINSSHRPLNHSRDAVRRAMRLGGNGTASFTESTGQRAAHPSPAL